MSSSGWTRRRERRVPLLGSFQLRERGLSQLSKEAAHEDELDEEGLVVGAEGAGVTRSSSL